MTETNTTLRVGQTVPNFKTKALLADGSFKEIQWNDYKGKWVVLFFYPLDFTFVCPTEIQAFNENYTKFQQAGAEVLTASTDSVYSHLAWTKSGLGQIRFPMIGDTNHSVSKLFNVLVEEAGIALRGTFIINPDGKLCSAVVNDLSVGRNVEETLRTLQAFQTGKLTGCNWKPGEKTLG